MRSFFLILIITFSSRSLLPAQLDMTVVSEVYQKGEIALLQGKYKKAIRLFQDALKMKPDLRAAQRGIGLCYDAQNNHLLALKYYKEILENDPWFSRVLYYQVGEAYYKIGEYDKAIFYFDKFDYLQAENDTKFTVNGEKERELELQLAAKLEDAIIACRISMDSAAFRTDVTVQNLGPSINSRFDEYFPFLSNDQTILFYTRRRGFNADENLYLSTFEKSHWKAGSPVNGPFNTKDNEGMCTMVRDGRTMFFTACNREEVSGPCDIWEATVEGTEINNPQPIRGATNSPGWESQAAISCDGRTLYFASTREGGYGGTDIWYCEMQPDGLWSSPINMGPKINTPKDEESPFITNDGQTFYFCSTGHLGLGSTDIFMSLRDQSNNWSTPVNLGPKVNSAYEDLGFFLSADGRTGYFASDRPGGFGGKDIYRVELSDMLTSSPVTFVEGFVVDSFSRAGVASIITISETEQIRTNNEGRFFLCLPANSVLFTAIDKSDYLPYARDFDIPEWDNRIFYELFLELIPTEIPVPKAVPIPPDTTMRPVARIRTMQRLTHVVYFDFDSDNIKNAELAGIDEFIQQLEGKDIQRIEINGYADDVGREKYNLELSEKRAKKMAMFLIDRGFIINKIAMNGMGSIRDDNPKKYNRKVELKVFYQE